MKINLGKVLGTAVKVAVPIVLTSVVTHKTVKAAALDAAREEAARILASSK